MISVILITVLIVLNGFFVAAEFAIVGAPRASVRRLANEGSRAAARLLRVLDDPIRQDRLIATAQLGITVASLGLGMVGEHAFAGWLAPRIGNWGIDRFVAAHTAATILSVAVLSYFHIVLGEMVPKSLSLHQPQRMALRILPLLRLVQLAMYPLVLGLNLIGNGVLKLMGIDRTAGSHNRYRTPDELAYEVRQSQQSGLLPDESAEVMQELLGFTNLLARSVMIPRVYVTGIPVGADAARIRDILRRSTHTRYPVYEGSLDCVLGVMHVKDILRVMSAGSVVTAEMARPATFVAESECVEDVLAAMRHAHTQMTIVMDEHGGTAGILTIEDLFEEVVGEIGERPDQSSNVAQDSEGRLRVLGTTRIEQVSEALGIPLSHERVDTISGLVLTLLGRPASVGDHVVHGGVALEVTRVRGRGVAECLVSTAPVDVERGQGASRDEDASRDTLDAGGRHHPEAALETLQAAVEIEASSEGALGTDAAHPPPGRTPHGTELAEPARMP